MTYAVGEQWCANPDPEGSWASPQRAAIVWAREFRYDGARARYLNRPLKADQFPSVQDAPGGQYVETIYDGNEPYGDRIGGVWSRSFMPGLARIEPFDAANPPTGGANTEYYHSDHLGTMRAMSDATGNALDHNGSTVSGVDTVYTAFGEPIVNVFADGESNRYGYVGAHGYQAHDEMPFLHVGARYYDPGSGRFLQRDPIGIASGSNVYAMVSNAPTILVDPSGLIPLGGHNPMIPGDGPSSGRPTAPPPAPPKPPPTRAQTKQNLDRWANTFYCIAGAGATTAAIGAATANPVLGVGGAFVGGVAGTIGGILGLVNSVL